MSVRTSVRGWIYLGHILFPEVYKRKKEFEIFTFDSKDKSMHIGIFNGFSLFKSKDIVRKAVNKIFEIESEIEKKDYSKTDPAFRFIPECDRAKGRIFFDDESAIEVNREAGKIVLCDEMWFIHNGKLKEGLYSNFSGDYEFEK